MTYTKKEFDAIVRKIKFITENFDQIKEEGLEFFTPIEVKVTKLTKREQKAEVLGRVLSKSNFGCQQDNVRELFSILIGEPITVNNKNLPVFYKSAEFYPFLAIVPIDNKNSHSYPLNEVSICLGVSDHAIRPSGTMGNHLPPSPSYNNKLDAALRLATTEEIDSWAESYEGQSSIHTDTDYAENISDDLLAQIEATMTAKGYTV